MRYIIYIYKLEIMKHLFTIVLLLVGLKAPSVQKQSAFQKGEWFKFEMSYSGFIKAGNATLSLSETNLNGISVYHVVGKGWTTGLIKAMFKVKDRYESFFDKETGVPYKQGDEIKTNMFFDEENYGFKLKYLGRETIKVDINGSNVKVKTLKFRPYVMAGRVFKEEESLTLWVSADKNKIPLKIINLITTRF